MSDQINTELLAHMFGGANRREKLIREILTLYSRLIAAMNEKLATIAGKQILPVEVIELRKVFDANTPINVLEEAPVALKKCLDQYGKI
jgi:hypothetical protein